MDSHGQTKQQNKTKRDGIIGQYNEWLTDIKLFNTRQMDKMDLDSRRQTIQDFTRQHFGHAGTRVYREHLTAGYDRRNKIEISAETVMGLLS